VPRTSNIKQVNLVITGESKTGQVVVPTNDGLCHVNRPQSVVPFEWFKQVVSVHTCLRQTRVFPNPFHTGHAFETQL